MKLKLIIFFLFQSIFKPAPFSQEKDAINERDTCDYNTKITMDMANSGLGMCYSSTLLKYYELY